MRLSLPCLALWHGYMMHLSPDSLHAGKHEVRYDSGDVQELTLRHEAVLWPDLPPNAAWPAAGVGGVLEARPAWRTSFALKKVLRGQFGRHPVASGSFIGARRCALRCQGCLSGSEHALLVMSGNQLVGALVGVFF